MPDQDPALRDREPVVHRKDRMAWPLLALVVAAVLLIVIFALFPTSPKVAAPAPRAEVPQQPGGDQLQISNLKMTASPPTGGMVSVRLAGTIQNVGGPKVNGATIEATFLDNSAHVAVQQTQPIERLTPQGNTGKAVALKDAPLKPNDTGAFEVTFTGVPQSWNNQLPEVRIVDVATTAPPLPESSGPTAANTGAASESAKPTPMTPKRRGKH